jgi:putative colanic acid biosynthesis acetyltransferase WcaF
MSSDPAPDPSRVTGPNLRRLGDFRGDGYDKGRPVVTQALWFAIMNLIFLKWWCPGSVRVRLLRAFGAQVGSGAVIRHRVRVLWPWKLIVGNDVWIGEGAWLLNLEPITVGDDVCISQEAFLCTGSHQWQSETFEFDNRPIRVEPGAWIGTRAVLLRGVTVGAGATVSAGAVVSKDVAPGTLHR